MSRNIVESRLIKYIFNQPRLYDISAHNDSTTPVSIYCIGALLNIGLADLLMLSGDIITFCGTFALYCKTKIGLGYT